MTTIDRYAYRSRLRKVDPLVKLFFSLLTLVVCLWANSSVLALIILLSMGLFTVVGGGVSVFTFMKLILVPFSFLTVAVITIVLDLGGSSVAFLYSLSLSGFTLGVTEEGIYFALRLFLKSLAAVSCLYYLSLSTPLTSLLSAFRKLKISGLLLELAALGYRFTFILIESAGTMLTAQQARLGYADLKTSYRSLGTLAAMLLMRSCRRGDLLYTAMEARCYSGEIRVLQEQYPNNRNAYLFALAFNIILVAGLLYSRGRWGGPFL